MIQNDILAFEFRMERLKPKKTNKQKAPTQYEVITENIPNWNSAAKINYHRSDILKVAKSNTMGYEVCVPVSANSLAVRVRETKNTALKSDIAE